MYEHDETTNYKQKRHALVIQKQDKKNEKKYKCIQKKIKIYELLQAKTRKKSIII